MSDLYDDKSSGLSDPAQGVLPVTPDDGADLSIVCRALYVGGAGTVTLRAIDNSQATFTVPGGGEIKVRTRRVLATGTTATGIVGLY
mgnify:CR=1 FL=1